MRWSFSRAGLAIFLLLDPSAHAASLPALRIQPLGDSITKGSLSSHGNGYRGYLRDLLTEESDNGVDMIGSLRDGSMRDNDHEGHSGEYLAEINEFYKLSIKARPNVVLLHAGTNNMDKERDLAKSPELMTSIIGGVHKEAPDAAILVMPVIWANDTRMQNNTDRFNEFLEGFIAEKQDDGLHIMSVPTDITIDDLADTKHPNDQGYEKMAKAWFDAILEANERGWLEEPVPVDADKLPGMGLGTRSGGEDDTNGGKDEDEDEDEDKDRDDDEDENGDENDDSSTPSPTDGNDEEGQGFVAPQAPGILLSGAMFGLAGLMVA